MAPRQSDQGATPERTLLHWVFPAMLALTAVDVLLSGRDLNEAFLELEKSAQSLVPSTPPALVFWGQRLLSILVVAASLQQIASRYLQGRSAPVPLLTAAFLAYWVASTAVPALFGANPGISHQYAYPLLLGLACTFTTPSQLERILLALRNALFIFMVAGVVLVPVQPSLVLEWKYSQGLLPGVPRFGGLAQHPVMMGVLSQLTLLVLCAHPFQRRWLNRAAWCLGLTVLFVAQSKTAWLTFAAGGACMWLVQGAPHAMKALGDPRRNAVGVSICLAVMSAALVMLAGVLVLDLPTRVSNFFAGREGAMLVSMTGRDRIWVVAVEEWRNNPVFGYGLSMWNSQYRQEVGMPNATDAHNQFFDTLGRAGVVGLIGLVLYALVLLGLAVRYAAGGRGLGLAMAVTVAMLSVSEVPLLLIDYGSHLLFHYVLVLSVAAAAVGKPRRSEVGLESLQTERHRPPATARDAELAAGQASILTNSRPLRPRLYLRLRVRQEDRIGSSIHTTKRRGPGRAGGGGAGKLASRRVRRGGVAAMGESSRRPERGRRSGRSGRPARYWSRLPSTIPDQAIENEARQPLFFRHTVRAWASTGKEWLDRGLAVTAAVNASRTIRRAFKSKHEPAPSPHGRIPAG